MPYPKSGLAIRLVNRMFALVPVKNKSRFFRILLKKRLDASASLNMIEGTSCSVADSDDIESIIGHPEALSEGVYRSRIDNGDTCYCLKQAGELVTYNWVRSTAGCFWCGRRNGFHFFPLQDKQVFTYDFYTYKKHRRKGLGACMKAGLLYDLQSRGVRDVFTAVNPSNKSSLRIQMRIGCEPVAAVFGYQLFNWTGVFLGSEKETLRIRRWLQLVCASMQAA